MVLSCPVGETCVASTAGERAWSISDLKKQSRLFRQAPLPYIIVLVFGILLLKTALDEIFCFILLLVSMS